MKILFNTMGLGKGGAERVINLLSNSFINNNEVLIVTNINSKIEYDFNHKIKIIPLVKSDGKIIRKIRRISFRLLLKLKRIIINYNPDIIISFLPEPSFRILALKKHCKKIKNIPTIISVRNDPNTEYSNKIYNYIMRKLYPYADQLVLQTNDSKKYFEELINYNGIVIPNPVSDIFLTQRYYGKRDKRIVAVGRLEPQKNYKNMIDAFEIVSEKHRDYIFEIYGDGYLKEDLRKYINGKKLSNKVLLMGKTDDVKNAIYKATAFVMSSDYEGMPNSLLEASCLGVPCISTDCPCGGPKEILESGKCGILVKVGDSKELSKGICSIIERPNIASKYSEYSNLNSNKFSKENIVNQWLNLINKMVIGDDFYEKN